jgi:hypothetical protein
MCGLFSMSEISSIQLSSKGLLSVEKFSRHDFEFVSGSNRLRCDRFQALYLSPRVSRALTSDPTIDLFLLNGADSKSFDMIQHLIRGEAFLLTESNFKSARLLAAGLGNEEFNEQVMEFERKVSELDLLNCVVRLNNRLQLGLEFSKEAAFIGAHFSELRPTNLQQLNIAALKEILEGDSLQIESEDELLDFVLGLDQDFGCLLGAVRLCFLGSESIDRLFAVISPLTCDRKLWNEIWDRMRHPVVLEESERESARAPVRVVKLADDPWSGLIRRLSIDCGVNVHAKQIVNISCSGTDHGNCSQVVDYVGTDYWHSRNSPDSWIQFEFKTVMISVTGYALKSSGNSCQFLRQWELRGSNDEQNWDILDRRNTQELDGTYITKTFTTSVGLSGAKSYRYIRLTQTAKNACGQDYLMLSQVEFFGSLRMHVSQP